MAIAGTAPISPAPNDENAAADRRDHGWVRTHGWWCTGRPVSREPSSTPGPLTAHHSDHDNTAANVRGTGCCASAFRPRTPESAHLRHQYPQNSCPKCSACANEARRTGTSVAENWVDGQQRAATNIARHADWLESSLHPQILALARAADDVATHTETLIRSTPRPEEFTDLRQRLQVALANYNTSGGANAAQVEALSTELSKKRAAAMSAMQGFSTAAPPTISGAAKPPQPAPPIVHNPDEPAQTLNPHGHPESGGDHDGTTEGRGHHSGGDYNADDLGSPDHPPSGAAAAPGNPTQVAPLAGATRIRRACSPK
ncbi:hypothetical protein [Mycobacterium szulgai]|uniref:hypothetical protein n=1 Tax=Mycobacterium szulgai TaxID=1787 RepID=UPI0021F2C84D|nr:hypothetical protein [Mycobacterium szulgai]MCV7075690.1 hypothetical protein [Mycobacterium szulgai]